MGRNWTQSEWSVHDMDTRHAVLSAPFRARRVACADPSSRAMLRNYSTSFFLVTRFLPAFKRAQVDVIYAAVRYPDEIVDTSRFARRIARTLL